MRRSPKIGDVICVLGVFSAATISYVRNGFGDVELEGDDEHYYQYCPEGHHLDGRWCFPEELLSRVAAVQP